MATITDIRPIDLYWLACNYNQGMLETLYHGGDASGVISAFKYTNEKSTSTNLHDVYFNLNIDHYADVRFGEGEAHGVSINYRLREAQIDEIEARGKEIEEIVTYYSKTNELVSADVNLQFDDYVQKNYFYLSPRSNIGYFNVMVKFTDGTITDYSINWGLELVNCTYSAYRDSMNQPVDGYPYAYNDDGSVAAAYPWKSGNAASKGSVQGFYGDWEQKTAFRLSHKCFQSHADALTYLKYGIDNSLDEDDGESGEPAEDRITTLFYASNIYKRSYNASDLERVGASTIYIDIQYAKNDGTIIVDKHRAICGYVNTDNEINDENHFGNIIWMAAPNTKIIETKQSWLNGGRATSKTLPQFATTTGFYPPLVDGSTIYESRYNTNMFIFANRQDAEAFLLGGNPKPIGGGGTGPFSPDKLVGDETEYNLHSAQLHNDMSSCWILSSSAVNELASIFATGVKQDTSNPDSAATVFESCLRGLSAHGEPIDMVCDLFWLPIDPTEFCNSESGTITVSRDSYGVLTAVKDISDEFGEHYKVSTAMNYNWVLGPAGQSIYTLNAIKESIQSVIGEEETSNKLHVGTHHDQSPIQ